MYNLLSSYQGRGVEHCEALKMDRFPKRIVPECRCTSINISPKTQLKTTLVHNYILNGKFNPKMDRIRESFSKIRSYFTLFKQWQGRSSLLRTSCTSASEYTPISMTIRKYPWKCLNNVLTRTAVSIFLVILNVKHDFEDVLSFKCFRVLNMAQLYM